MYHGQRCPASRGKSALDVHRRDRDDAARPQRVPDRAQVGGGVGQVLDDVPDRDRVEGVGRDRAHPRRRRSRPCLREPRVRALGGPARRLDAGDLVARLLGELEEGADVAADVEQLAAGRVALHVAGGCPRTSRRGPPPPRRSARPRPRRTGPAPSGGAGAGSCTRASSCGTRRSSPSSGRTPCEVDV